MSLPNFMCIGAAKSGTTTLYDILKQHPEIFIPRFKEPHFFDIPENYKNGIKWYEKSYFSKANKKIIADFTPSYLFDPHSPERIYKQLGKNIKFLVILRNPVDRAYSHYLHSLRDEYEYLDFISVLKIEKERLDKYAKESDYLSYLQHSYFHQGLYGEMVARYLKFFSLKQFLFIHFEEDLLRNKKQTIIKILDFLEVDSKASLKIDFKSNPASKSRSKKFKKIMQKTGWWRVLLKALIPSLKIRQIIKNKLQRLNNRKFTPKSIQREIRAGIYKYYFSEDIKRLEKIISRKMNW
jgi:hypothetical protein